MISVGDLPTLNAILNATSAILLIAGYVLIRGGRVTPHKACMLSAFIVSILFLISYLVYHAKVGSVPYAGQGPIRTVYFTILVTHIVLAAAVPPLAIVTIALAWRERIASHRALARWTLPIWLYVSITGVAIYVMLYG